MRETRKLAAIVVADVVGYSRNRSAGAADKYEEMPPMGGTATD